MSSEIVKVKLRSGSNEIEIEGPKTDVDYLLERWWRPAVSGAGNDEDGEEAKRAQQKRPARKPAAREKGQARETGDSGIDANEVANQVKENEEFALIEQKILHAPGDRYNKVAFVVWFLNRHLTSGEIYRALVALHVKIDLPAVSKTLKSNMQNFITDKRRVQGGAPAAYQLTSKARSDFEKWLRTKDA